MSDLTEDLVEEILVKVPATSLKRLRPTCKKWNSLFNDQRFTKKHFDKASKEYMDIILRDHRLSSIRVNLQGLDDNNDPSSAIKLKGNHDLHLHCNSTDHPLKVFHCNGLLLITNPTTILVWNPCTGQSKWIQTKSVNTRNHKYALGYENKNSCRNYKILRLLDYQTFEVEIYEFNSDSWRVLDNFINPDFRLHIGGMSVHGNTYWIASDNEEDEEIVNCFLISFDFTKERFGPHVCLPFQGFVSSDTMSLSSVREERLSVLFQDEVALTIEIWMTINNDIIGTNSSSSMSWSKFLRIDLNTHLFLNGLSFFIDEENKVAVFCEDVPDDDINTVVYIIGQDGRWRIVDPDEDGPFWPDLFSYVPTLVLI